MIDDNFPDEPAWKDFFAVHGFADRAALENYLKQAGEAEIKRLSDDFEHRKLGLWRDRFPERTEQAEKELSRTPSPLRPPGTK